MRFDDYTVEVWYSSKDEAYLARVPEVQGCIADGQTRQEAISEVEKVFDLMMETIMENGDPIPQPRREAALA